MNDTASARTRTAVNAFLARMGSGDIDGCVALFAEDGHWEIPGDPAIVPWVGARKVSEIPDFFRTIGTLTDREAFDVEHVLVDGEHAVLIGRARVVVRATGRVADTPFAIHVTVNAEGRITRFYMFEDSWSVARATTG
jgi:ketosteroid isomerase-like protein